MLTFVLPLLAIAAAPAPVDGLGKVAVMKTEVAVPADAPLGQQLSARLADVLRVRGGGEVITGDEINALLEHEQDRQLVGCADDGCLAELANALGVDAVLHAKLSRVDGGVAIAVALVDAKSASVRGRVNDTWGGDSVSLLSLAPSVVDRLLAQAAGAAAPTGALDLVGALDGSKILVDDVVRGTAPAGQMAGLGVGAHRVSVVHPDREPFSTWVVVDAGVTASVPVQQGVAEPFYGTWWFWTGTGVVVAGAAAAVGAAVLLTNGGRTGVEVQVNADDKLEAGR